MTKRIYKDYFKRSTAEVSKFVDNLKVKLQAAIVNRLNDVIRANGIVAKTVARTH